MTIEEKVKKVAEDLKKKLDKRGYPYTYVNTKYVEKEELKDGTIRPIIFTSIIENIFYKSNYFYTDVETLEILYIQTDVVRFTTPENYFSED